jgi:hypothetical protein
MASQRIQGENNARSNHWLMGALGGKKGILASKDVIGFIDETMPAITLEITRKTNQMITGIMNFCSPTIGVE